jgi:general secretion pathway protein G
MPTMLARGFTLIELLVVMAALGLLLALAAPRYYEHVDRSREVVLRHNLAAIRQAVDRFRGDRGRYPEELAELVRLRYLRDLPLDPITDRTDSWVVLPPPGQPAGVFDVRSAAPGRGRDGSAYAAW